MSDKVDKVDAAIKQFMNSVATLRDIEPTLPFKLILYWLTENVATTPCLCNNPDCPSKLVRSLIATADKLVSEQLKSEKRGDSKGIMRGATVKRREGEPS